MKNIPRTGLVLSLVGIVFLAATVLYPCIPFPDPMGETVFLSRLDYVLAVLGHPEAVWGQWLGEGDGPRFFDRVPILLRAVATVAVCWSLGRWLVALDRLERHMPRVAHFAMSIIVGYVIVNVAMYILQRWFRIDHWLWPWTALFLCYAVLWLLKRRCEYRHPNPKRERGILRPSLTLRVRIELGTEGLSLTFGPDWMLRFYLPFYFDILFLDQPLS